MPDFFFILLFAAVFGLLGAMLLILLLILFVPIWVRYVGRPNLKAVKGSYLVMLWLICTFTCLPFLLISSHRTYLEIRKNYDPLDDTGKSQSFLYSLFALPKSYRSTPTSTAPSAAPPAQATDGWRSAATGISVGSRLYLHSDKAFIGKVLSITPSHTFPDGTTQEGVEMEMADGGPPVWVPRRFANMYYFTK